MNKETAIEKRRRIFGITQDQERAEGVNTNVFRPALQESDGKQVYSGDLLSIDIRIGNYRLKANLQEAIYYGREDLTELRDQEIDQALDKSTELRISVGIAYAHVQQAVEEAENEFLMFEQLELRQAQDRLISAKQIALGKVTAKMFDTTKDEKFSEMLADEEIRNMWKSMRSRISELRRDATILKRVDEALSARTIFLSGISKRKFTERTGNFSL